MAAGSFNFYNGAAKHILETGMSAMTVVVALTTSSYTPSAAHATESDLTNELSGSGYSRQTVSSPTITTVDTNDAEFDDDGSDVAFTASGGNLTARYAVYIDTGTSPGTLLGYYLLDDTPADVTVTDGGTLTIQFNANGLLRATVA